GVSGSTSVNIAINVIQITALVVFSVLALGYRMNHRPGSVAYQFDSASGDAYTYEFATEQQLVNGQPADVVLRDSCGDPNPKPDVPIAVVTSLLVQGAFCYLFEYFAANYFLNNGYTMVSATGSAAPLGDMMVIVGNAVLGGHGRLFMLVEAFTVFLAIIGT